MRVAARQADTTAWIRMTAERTRDVGGKCRMRGGRMIRDVGTWAGSGRCAMARGYPRDSLGDSLIPGV